MDQLRTFAIVLNSASVFFLHFHLTGFKISACREEERNNRATGKEKTKVIFS